MPITRRHFLSGLSALTLGAAGAGLAGPGRAAGLVLEARETSARILAEPTRGLMSYADGAMPPVLRLRQGEPAQIAFRNSLAEASTVHWHGIRGPVEMDGVPFVTQLPVQPGQGFDYAFTPPDAGTFWYHPHCNTFEQLQKGLNGIVIVEEAKDPGFDADLPVLLRDFRLDEAGQFTTLSTPRNAARGGTLGTVMTANWQVDPALMVPTGGLVRLRLANTDVTRVHALYLPGATGTVLALDGHPVEVAQEFPDAVERALLLAPGQRADLAVLAPASEGLGLDIMTARRAGDRRLFRLMATGASRTRQLADTPVLPPNPLSPLQLDGAEKLDFVFGWSPAGTAEGGSDICGETGVRFWSINRIAAAADGAPSRPLANLKLGQSYILSLRNETQNDHPIHLHGLAFRLLRSNKRPLLPQWTDTALLRAGETIEVGLVADNPGEWVFHCHVIEHQKTGLAGSLYVGA